MLYNTSVKKSLVFVSGIVIGVIGTLGTLYVLKLCPQEAQGYLFKPYYYPQIEYNLKPKSGSYIPVNPGTYNIPSGAYTQPTGTYIPVEPEL